MHYLFEIKISILLIGIFLLSCNKELRSFNEENIEKREFNSSFESVDDFSGFYLTPQAYKNTTYHELSNSIVHSGEYAHKAWITGANPPSTNVTNNNHRGYPTVQFQKTSDGVFKSPCYITLWVWLDMDLQEHISGGEDDWFSFATFTGDTSDNWKRSVLVNLDPNGFVHLMHTTGQNKKDYIFQTTNTTFPQKEWVELKMYIDFSNNGYIKVWQNGELVSHANVKNVKNQLSQAHFGLYCSPQLESGTVYNDDLTIIEVDKE